ncbi:hypothetical protein [Roseibium hamelinense]|uniref:hypothetical protein n=1 Tax=Roseibium hamelinense TaxID=150831 RepID=UPI0014784458|nr:hypothetical protein [Roseibium hamelinense]
MSAHTSHAFFDPLWRRILLVLVCAAWVGVELYHGNQTWALITGGIAVYAAWSFLVTYKKMPGTGKDPG